MLFVLSALDRGKEKRAHYDIDKNKKIIYNKDTKHDTYSTSLCFSIAAEVNGLLRRKTCVSVCFACTHLFLLIHFF